MAIPQDQDTIEFTDQHASGILRTMSTAELIYEKIQRLPESLQTEALHYVDFLLTQRHAQSEAADWAQFSALQLAKQYAPEDAIYDNY